VQPAVAVRPGGTTTDRPGRPGGPGSSPTPAPPSSPSSPGKPGGPGSPGGPGTPTPSSPPANARTHLLSVGAALAPSSGAPHLSVGVGRDLLGSLSHLQLLDVGVDLSGLLPGAKLDLGLVP
jgi:hypothetical protein